MFRFLTAGESHGPGLTAIVDGVPAGISISAKDINVELKRRQGGFGRGGRMDIESDAAEILGGVREGMTIGSPVSILIRNKDYKNWQDRMSVEATGKKPEPITTPRPGHADMAGYLKYGFDDIRNVIERASARETAARTAVGAVAKKMLTIFDIRLASNVLSIGDVKTESVINDMEDAKIINGSQVRCINEKASKRMVEAIKKAKEEGDTLGGVFEIVVFGLPPGLGSYTQWDMRLDSRLAGAVMSIPAIKGVAIGDGFAVSEKKGSQVHDEMSLTRDKRIKRTTNRAGGLEGGVTNGEPVRVTAAMKPIPTLKKPLHTVDVKSTKEALALKERSDVCAVPSAAVVGEAVVAIEVAKAFLEKFGGDSIKEIERNLSSYKEGM